MVGLYMGGNRYRVEFQPLADFSTLGPGPRRGEEIAAGVRAYAAALERYCREAPFNWFNFFDFWRGP
jgi:predicted LPLAT superfamily acyltransferase